MKTQKNEVYNFLFLNRLKLCTVDTPMKDNTNSIYFKILPYQFREIAKKTHIR